MRQITTRGLLYTEMIVAQALHYSKNINKLLDFHSSEHPISLQIGGDNPKLLSEAAKLGEEWGYDEINLNIGCPSPRVQSGNFGACLMKDPEHVAQCIDEISKHCNLPITVKHRIGVDDFDSYQILIDFVDKLSNAGAKRFSIHARKAWLKGLNPKENRTVPPLNYERVIQLKKDRPNIKIELNGGIKTIEECLKALEIFDGSMVGRAAYEHPLIWKDVDEMIYGDKRSSTKASTVLIGMLPYAEYHLKNNGKLWDIAKHLLKLVEGVPGARSWRKDLGASSQNKEAKIEVLEKAANKLIEAGL